MFFRAPSSRPTYINQIALFNFHIFLLFLFVWKAVNMSKQFSKESHSQADPKSNNNQSSNTVWLLLAEEEDDLLLVCGKNCPTSFCTHSTIGSYGFKKIFQSIICIHQALAERWSSHCSWTASRRTNGCGPNFQTYRVDPDETTQRSPELLWV